MPARVAVTGLGVISNIGLNANDFWNSLMESGVVFNDFEDVKHLITINSTPSDIYTTYSAVQGEYFDD